MGLGPRIDIRQSQSLVLTPQLTQAIKLLQLSNLELDALIAEEMSKNPLIEAAGGEEEGEAPDHAPVSFEGESASE
jgi:RNA polymerase sigma-54 factor